MIIGFAVSMLAIWIMTAAGGRWVQYVDYTCTCMSQIITFLKQPLTCAVIVLGKVL